MLEEDKVCYGTSHSTHTLPRDTFLDSKGLFQDGVYLIVVGSLTRALVNHMFQVLNADGVFFCLPKEADLLVQESQHKKRIVINARINSGCGILSPHHIHPGSYHAIPSDTPFTSDTLTSLIEVIVKSCPVEDQLVLRNNVIVIPKLGYQVNPHKDITVGLESTCIYHGARNLAHTPEFQHRWVTRAQFMDRKALYTWWERLIREPLLPLVSSRHLEEVDELLLHAHAQQLQREEEEREARVQAAHEILQMNTSLFQDHKFFSLES